MTHLINDKANLFLTSNQLGRNGCNDEAGLSSCYNKKILKIIKNTNVSLAKGACNHIYQRILVPIPLSQDVVGTSLPHPIRNAELEAMIFYSFQIQLSNIAISVKPTGRELHIFRHFLLSIISSLQLQLVIRITERKTILELKI